MFSENLSRVNLLHILGKYFYLVKILYEKTLLIMRKNMDSIRGLTC